MRHGKQTFKVGRTSSHRRCMLANMLKSLIENERIETTVTKAKELRRHADRMITLAKRNTLASRRKAVAELMESQNSKNKVVGKLFGPLSERFAQRQGGYTRIIRLGERAGDNASTCLIEFLSQ